MKFTLVLVVTFAFAVSVNGRVYYLQNLPAESAGSTYPLPELGEEQSSRDLDLSFATGGDVSQDIVRPVFEKRPLSYAVLSPEKPSILDLNGKLRRRTPRYRLVEVPTTEVENEGAILVSDRYTKPSKTYYNNGDKVIVELRVIAGDTEVHPL